MDINAPTSFKLHSDESESGLTRRDLVGLLFKHKGIILKTFVIVTVLITLGLLYLPPIYKVKGKILVKTERQGNPTFFSGIASYEEKKQADPVNRTMETEMELVEARTVAEEVVRLLDIKYKQVYHKPYVHLLIPVGNALEPIMSLFGFPPDPKKQGFQDTVTELVDSIQVAPVKSKTSETTSNIMEVTLRTHDKELSAKALLAIMETYQKQNMRINRAAGERAFKIIETRKKEAFTDLIQHQLDLENFLKENKGNKDIQSSSRGGYTGGQSSISLMKKQVVEKELELEELRQTYNSGHFLIQNLEQAIENLKKKIETESRKYASSDSELRSLERKMEISENLYLELEKKLNQIRIYLDMNENEIASRIILEPPLPPRKSEWKKDAVLGLLGSLAGLLLGIGIAGYREYSDNRLDSTSEIQSLFGIEVLGTIPELSEEDISANSNILVKDVR